MLGLENNFRNPKGEQFDLHCNYFVNLQSGTLQEYQKRMKKLDQQYKERIRNAGKAPSQLEINLSGVLPLADHGLQHNMARRAVLQNVSQYPMVGPVLGKRDSCIKLLYP